MTPNVRMTPRIRLHAGEFGQQLLAKIHMMIDVSSHMKCQNGTQRQTSRRGIRAAVDDRYKFLHEMQPSRGDVAINLVSCRRDDTKSLHIVPSVHGSNIDLSACPGIIPWRVSRCRNSDADRRYARMLAHIQCCLVAQCTSAVQ
jgi:hypothetical protein